MAAEGHDRDRLAFSHALAMRYVGQSHELEVAFRPGADGEAARLDFDQAHLARFGYARAEAPVEVVSLRLSTTAPAEPPVRAERAAAADERGEAAVVGRRRVWMSGEWREAVTFDRAALGQGATFDGPALVFQYDTTTLVPPGWHAVVDRHGYLVLSREDALRSGAVRIGAG
jgi:N-methylhydantoinase A